MARFTRSIYRGTCGSWDTFRHATDLGTSPTEKKTTHKKRTKTNRRKRGQARLTVVFIGLILVGLGVFTTVTYHSNSGAAARVAGGVLAVLAGAAGGSVTVRSEGEQETRMVSAGRAQLVGDAEGAFDRFVQL